MSAKNDIALEAKKEEMNSCKGSCSKKAVEVCSSITEVEEDDREVSFREFLKMANQYIEKDKMCEFSMQYKDMQISFSTTPKGGYAPMPQMMYGPAPQAASEAGSTAAAKPKEEESGKEIKSNMVGTIYLAPSPTDEPYIKVGSEVKEGQTIFIIEAMKVMSHFKSPMSGTVKEILVNNEETVEYGKVLVRLS